MGEIESPTSQLLKEYKLDVEMSSDAAEPIDEPDRDAVEQYIDSRDVVQHLLQYQAQDDTIIRRCASTHVTARGHSFVPDLPLEHKGVIPQHSFKIPELPYQRLTTSNTVIVIKGVAYKPARIEGRFRYVSEDGLQLGAVDGIASRKMSHYSSDDSALSTTQEIENHIYERLEEDGIHEYSSQSQLPPQEPAPRTINKDGTYSTLGENDTGYVKLDFEPTSPARSSPESQISLSQNPKTPAPQNPFRNAHAGNIMAASQMFSLTQPSPAIEETPTTGANVPSSSRPSPDIFNQAVQRSSVSPSERGITDAMHSRAFEQDTSSSSQPLSQILPRTTGRAQPRDTYISVRDSQERKRGHQVQTMSQTSAISDEDFRDDEAAIRRAANAKRAQGLKLLSRASMPPVTSSRPSDRIEVPSTAKSLRHRNGHEEYLARDEESDSRNSRQVEAILDSQTRSQASMPASQPSAVQYVRYSTRMTSKRSCEASTQSLDEQVAMPSSIETDCGKSKTRSTISEITQFGPFESIAEPAMSERVQFSCTEGRERAESQPHMLEVVKKRNNDIIFETSPVTTPSIDSSALTSLTGSTPTHPASSSPTATTELDLENTGNHSVDDDDETITVDTNSSSTDFVQDPLVTFAPKPVRPRGQQVYGRRSKRLSRLVNVATHNAIIVDGGETALSKEPEIPEKVTSRTLRALAKSDTPDIRTSAPTRSARRANYHGPVTPSKSLRAASNLSRHSGSGLFAYMIFCVSYLDNQDQKLRILKLIGQQGGTVLADGFDELFETATTTHVAQELILKAQSSNFGFACLIADDYSRKTKYMQALALGLPCLSGSWIEHCVSKADIVPWEPYLLAAGESSFLGGATKSRQLAYYPATSAKISETVKSRPSILSGKRILLVVGKGKEARKEPYVFLAQALGARSVKKVQSNDDARRVLLEFQDTEEAWNWVYIDDDKDEGRKKLAELTILGSCVSPSTRSRKRKRVSTAAILGNDTVKAVKIVGDEYIIQSLIFGGLIDEIS